MIVVTVRRSGEQQDDGDRNDGDAEHEQADGVIGPHDRRPVTGAALATAWAGPAGLGKRRWYLRRAGAVRGPLRTRSAARAARVDSAPAMVRPAKLTPIARADARRQAQSLLRELDALPADEGRQAAGLRRALRTLVARCSLTSPAQLDAAEVTTLRRLRCEVAEATLRHSAPWRAWVAGLGGR